MRPLNSWEAPPSPKKNTLTSSTKVADTHPCLHSAENETASVENKITRNILSELRMFRKFRVPRTSLRRKVTESDKFNFGDLTFEDGLAIPNGVPASKECV